MKTIQLILFCLLVGIQYIAAQNTCFFEQERIGTIATLGEFIAQNELADIDNDGDLDYLMAYGTENKVLEIYLNEEGGTIFEPFERLNFSDFAEGLAFTLGDVNNDGFVDIIDADLSTGRNAEIRLRSNRAADGFETQVIYKSPTTEQFRSAPRLVDFDNDGDLDVSMGVSSFGSSDVFRLRVLVLENQGDGVFEERTIVEREDFFLSAIVQTEWADLDNNGTHDLLINYDADNLRFLEIYLNDGEGNMSFHSSPIGQNETLVVQPADMDNDGDKDLVTISTSDGPGVYLNNGLEFTPVFISAEVRPLRFRLADINHDGLLDIALAGLFINDNVFEFRTEIIENFSGTAYGSRSSERDAVDMIFGDLNRDKRLDPVVTYIQDQVSFVQHFFSDTSSDFCVNESPNPPQNLISSPEDRTVILTWDEAEDAEQSSRALTYNILLYETESNRIIISPDSDLERGERRLVNFGRQGHHPKWLFRNLETGRYRWRVQAIDQHYQASEWSEEEEFIIFDCNEFSVASSSETASCGFDNGRANLDPMNGTAPFQVQWSNGATTASIENLAAGSYAFTVVDANDCESIGKIDIQNIAPPALPVSNGNVSTCSLEEAPPLSVQAVDGIEMNWYETADATSPIRTNSTLFFTSSTATYFVEAFDPSTGCTSISRTAINFTLNERPNLSIDTECDIAQNVYNIFFTTDVQVDVETSREVISVDGRTFQINNVPLGEAVDITVFAFESGCSSGQTISSPDCSCPNIAAPQGNNLSICEGDDSATPLSVFVEDGLSANWFDANENLIAQNSITFLPPSAGSYFVQAIDSMTACTSDFLRLEYSILPLPNIEITGDLQVCEGETTLLTASGGLEYRWDNESSDESIRVGAGTYTLIGFDMNACQNSTTVTVTEFPTIVANITGNTSLCEGEETILTATGGETYRWNTGETSAAISVDEAGIYEVTGTDENGCAINMEVQVNINLNPNVDNITASCDSNLETYSITISTTETNIVSADMGDSRFFEGLFFIENIPNNSLAVIRVENPETGCFILQEVQENCTCPNIEPPTNLGDVFVCEGEALTALQIDVLDNQTAEWYDAEVGGNFLARGTSFLATEPGTYFAQAVDATTNCPSERIALTLEIFPSPNLGLTTNGLNCFGDTTATITVLTNGGIAPYTFLWSNAATSESLQNVGAGVYGLTLTDSNQCSSSEIIEIFEPEELQANIQTQNTTCGEANGSILLELQAENLPLSVEWNEAISSFNPENLAAGIYTASITDALGCTWETDEIEVLGSSAPSISLLSSTIPECGEANASIEVEVTGGTAPYTYLWSNEATSSSLTNIPEGIYTLNVTDVLGCIASFEVNLICEIACRSAVGTMGTQQIESCETEIVSATYDGMSEFLEEGDLRQFVLHNGSTISIGNQIIARASEPIFAFAPAQMQTEATYYIVAIIGDDDGAGNVDLLNECIAVSNGTPVRFSAAPSAVIELQTTNTTICLGDSLQLSAAIEGVADSFFWETPQGMFTTPSENLVLPFFTQENVGDYFVSYFQTGCESPQFGPISITLDQSIENMTAGDNQILCGDTETRLEASLPPNAIGRWVTTSSATIHDPDNPSTRISNLEPGAYNTFFWRVYTNACTAVDTMSVYYLPAPELEDKQFEMAANNTAILLNKDFLFDGDARLLPREMIEFEILTQPNFGAVWDTIGGLLYEKDLNQTQDETIQFSYQACVTDSICGQLCEGANVEILLRYADSEVIAWRSALRPNGNNPLWSVQVLKNLSEAAVKIVDRWGQIVHVRQLNDGLNLRRGSTIADAWDGRNRDGELLPQGAYYFLFTGITDELEEVEPVNGVIYLMD